MTDDRTSPDKLRHIADAETLTDLQRRMLTAGAWVVDGYTSQCGREQSADLQRRGLARSWEIGGDREQYTGWQFEATPAGQEMAHAGR